MKRILIASLALVLSLNVFAQTSGVGIGARIGTGIDFSAKFWTGETSAFQIDAGLDYTGVLGMGVHADGSMLFHSWSWKVAQDQMKVYYGPGVGLGIYFYDYYGSAGFYETRAYFNIGLRAPSGVAYYFHSIPLELFAELTPAINFFDSTGFDFGFDWGSFVGAHWYF